MATHITHVDADSLVASIANTCLAFKKRDSIATLSVRNCLPRTPIVLTAHSAQRAIAHITSIHLDLTKLRRHPNAFFVKWTVTPNASTITLDTKRPPTSQQALDSNTLDTLDTIFSLLHDIKFTLTRLLSNTRYPPLNHTHNYRLPPNSLSPNRPNNAPVVNTTFVPPPENIMKNTTRRSTGDWNAFKAIKASEKIGKGGFGTVYKVKVTNDILGFLKNLKHKNPAAVQLQPGQTIAVKVQRVSDYKALKQAANEVHVQRQMVKTDVVPRVYASGLFETTIFIVAMERVKGVTIGDYLKTHRTLPMAVFNKLESAAITFWMKGYAHADLNTKNVFILPNGDVRIIDFGLSHKLPSNLVPKTRKEAVSREFHDKLLRFLDKRRSSYAPDPFMLRYLYAHVPVPNRMFA